MASLRHEAFIKEGRLIKLNFDEGRLLNKRRLKGKVKETSRSNFLLLTFGTFAT